MDITGTLDHAADNGDGVRGRIVASRAGIVGEWSVKHSKAATNANGVAVQAGDTIDFVVDFREGLDSDQYLWAPKISEVGQDPASNWDATRDFAGPVEAQLSPWEQLAQVILMANELMFVD